ncbi:MAG: DNA repair protein RecO [Gemmatimonadota bacterium]|nr:DNA repair protein RecO [Gemmatimonadota bacterium]
MPLVTTEAIVLHAFDYRETSRIVRLITRELGIVSAIARGARRPRNKFGAALDLFAGGEAELATAVGRDLHTLQGFDAHTARPALAASLDRFAAAAALAELLLRFAPEQEDPGLLDAVTDALDALVVAPPGGAGTIALGGAWCLVAELGFAPTLDECASCHTPIEPTHAASFHHRAGGVLCASCGRQAPGTRTLPPDARDAIRGWLGRHPSPALDDATLRAHQRLLREFLEEHLTDGGRPLRALLAWERHEVDA